ncbi:type VI secretion system tip protein TssI/VgrG [Vibrio jasicida]|uniref:type VI secretion system tip protein TssI/VgrG n=1 Tax=Vibrio jasicida TaxID=766224 RepID=UPI0021571643|nr:type VI secretion system tip protein TssI/VgrG [Vibrio jasicida]
MVNDVNFTFDVSGFSGAFKVESFRITETVSSPFEMNLTVLSDDDAITFDMLSRKMGVLSLFGQGVGAARQFNGSISELRYLGSGRRFSRYHIILVPHLWFLTQRQDCRIFQMQTAPDILRQVFDDAGMSDYRFELSAQYEAKEYVLQYRENDQHFVQRLMAEHGLWYYFEHSDAGHSMVIVDSNDAIPELISSPTNASYLGPVIYHTQGGGTPDREHIFDLEQIHRTRTGLVSYGDYNYLTPKIPQGTSADEGPNFDLRRYDYLGRYTTPELGQQRATEWMSEYTVDSHQIEAASDIMRLTAGYSFDISQHPRSNINRDYLMLTVMHTGFNPRVHEEESSDEPTTYHNQFVCLPRDVTFRAPKMASPVVDGPQTAVVVGPAGEEIYTDEYGRIKVQFHWDRYAQNDEHSSCWLRVSQSMAAPNWGAVYLPRIGHEVIVTFLEGDPDRPLVTGAVYNGLHTPPYALPENKTRTVFRTQSHKAEGYNEMYFEDESDQEEVHFRAQKDMKTEVLNNRYRDIGNDEELKVARNQENEIKGDRKEEIDGHKTSLTKQTFIEQVEQDVSLTYNQNESKKVTGAQSLTIYDNRKTLIGGSDTREVLNNSSEIIKASRSIDVGSDDTQGIGNHLSVEVSGNTSIRSDGQTAVVSADEIAVKVGFSGLVLKSNGNILLYGSDITIDGASTTKVLGSKVKMNPNKGAVRFTDVTTRAPKSVSALSTPSAGSAVTSASPLVYVQEPTQSKHWLALELRSERDVSLDGLEVTVTHSVTGQKLTRAIQNGGAFFDDVVEGSWRVTAIRDDLLNEVEQHASREESVLSPVSQRAQSELDASGEKAKQYKYVTVGDLWDEEPEDDFLRDYHGALDSKHDKTNAGLRVVSNETTVIEVKALRSYLPLVIDTDEYSLVNSYTFALLATQAYASDVYGIPDSKSPALPEGGLATLTKLLQQKIKPKYCASFEENWLLEEVPYSKHLNYKFYRDEAIGCEGYLLSNDEIVIIGVRGTQTYFGNTDIYRVGDTSWAQATKKINGVAFKAIEVQDGVRAFFQSEGYQDVMTDLDASQISIAELNDSYVHQGFYQYASAFWKLIERDVQQNKNKSFYVCGHSLGGAGALLISALIEEMVRPKSLRLFTFGMPRTGTHSFVDTYNDIIHYRHVNNHDLVPQVPFKWANTNPEDTSVIEAPDLLDAETMEQLTSLRSLIVNRFVDNDADNYHHHGNLVQLLTYSPEKHQPDEVKQVLLTPQQTHITSLTFARSKQDDTFVLANTLSKEHIDLNGYAATVLDSGLDHMMSEYIPNLKSQLEMLLEGTLFHSYENANRELNTTIESLNQGHQALQKEYEQSLRIPYHVGEAKRISLKMEQETIEELVANLKRIQRELGVLVNSPTLLPPATLLYGDKRPQNIDLKGQVDG